MKRKIIEGVDVIIKPQAYGHSISLLGDYCSNFGQVNKEGRLSMEWEWGTTPKVVEFIKLQTKKGQGNDI
jgi:hypothetical protein